MLAVPVRIPSASPSRLVLLHGFTQSGEFWRTHAEALSPYAETLAVDLPGHGATPEMHDASDLRQSAELVADAGGTAIYVGYSLGARVALNLACDFPALVHGLILFGPKAGFEEPAQRARRQAADEAMAKRLESEGVAAFIDEWLSQPFNVRLPESGQRRHERLRNRASGLAASLRHCGAARQQPLWDRVHEITAPVLVVHGSADMPHIVEDCSRLVQAIGSNASLEVVPDSGHAAPFEQPALTVDLIRRFLA